MTLERFTGFLARLSPTERDREKAKILADRFDSIKPELKKLKVEVDNFGYLTGKDRVTKITLRVARKRAERVAELLKSAKIDVIEKEDSILTRKFTAVEMAEKGLIDSRQLRLFLDQKLFVIFESSHINDEDLHRLVTLEPKIEF